jgi:hypothetical protein
VQGAARREERVLRKPERRRGQEGAARDVRARTTALP